jgi:DNA helicase TIP49 (TBP-interacting protein)
MSKALIGILETYEIFRLQTDEELGRVADIGDRFVFKAKSSKLLSEEENKQIAEIVEHFNDRSAGDFWQRREAEIQASLSHLDVETRAAQSALKAIFGNGYVIEEDVRRSVSCLPKWMADAWVELWKEGELVPRGRTEYGEIRWAVASADSAKT